MPKFGLIHIVTGLPGSGKTKVAKIIARSVNGLLINTDDVRNILFARDGFTGAFDFTPNQLEVIYKVLPVVMTYVTEVAPSKDIVFDGTFRLNEQRETVRRAANKLNREVSVVVVSADERDIKDRIDHRHTAEGHQATFETYLKVRGVYEIPIDAWAIDNSGKLADLAQKVYVYLQSKGLT